MLRCNFSEGHITSFEVGFGSIFSSQRSSARRRSTFTASTIVKNYKKCHLVISKLEALITNRYVWRVFEVHRYVKI